MPISFGYICNICVSANNTCVKIRIRLRKMELPGQSRRVLLPLHHLSIITETCTWWCWLLAKEQAWDEQSTPVVACPESGGGSTAGLVVRCMAVATALSPSWRRHCFCGVVEKETGSQPQPRARPIRRNSAHAAGPAQGFMSRRHGEGTCLGSARHDRHQGSGRLTYSSQTNS